MICLTISIKRKRKSPMSIRYNGNVRRDWLPEFWVVVLDNYEISFGTLDEANAFIKAASRAQGRYDYKSVNHPTSRDSYCYTHVISKIDISDPTTRSAPFKDDVLDFVEWESYTGCDGVPRADGNNCGCWRDFYGEMPDDWMDYVERQPNGDMVTKHICPKCQSKEMRVSYQKVITCEIK
jgi:hypothetical protein